MAPATVSTGARTPRLASAVVTTTLIQILSTMTALALTAIAPTVAASMGVEPYLVGYQISVIYLAGMVASAGAGSLVARYGAVRIEQAALACYAVGLAGLATGQILVALAASLVIGLGYGLQNPASSHILGAVTPPHRRNVVFSIKQAGVPIGGVLASVAFPLLAPLIGWRVALLLAGLPCLAVIAVLAREHRGDAPVAPHRQSLRAGFLAEQRLIWTSPALRVLAVLGMLYSSIQLSLSAFAATMLVAQGWSLVGAGAAAAVMQACGAVGRMAWGIVADRRGSGFAVLGFIGFASMACMIALVALGQLPPVLQVALIGVFGFCISGWNGVLMAEVTYHSPPGQTSRVIGGALVYTFIGVALGPSGFATLYDACGSYGLSFLLMSGIAGLGGVMATLAAIRRPRDA